tara:strand:- start:4231 stop:4962 length:732 start_codon:yes stop_codon:yes gene_type:complete
MRNKIPFGIAVSATEEGNGAYGEMMPKSFIYDDYTPELIEKFVNRQKYMVTNKKKNPEAFLILDDMMADSKKIMKDTNIRFIYLNGRHFKITMITAAQFSLDSGGPSIRANIDYVFLLRENVVANQEKLYKHFFGIFPTFNMFQQTLMACTENYGMLVLDNTSRSNKIEDCVFWYRAEFHPRVKLCSPAVWKLDKKLYDKNCQTVSANVVTNKVSTAQKGRDAKRNATFQVNMSNKSKSIGKK